MFRVPPMLAFPVTDRDPVVSEVDLIEFAMRLLVVIVVEEIVDACRLPVVIELAVRLSAVNVVPGFMDRSPYQVLPDC
jgi:hypothetical protein